eukprot:gnl/Chilomastix_caulleri/5513.p1 GENE.gnl/Chilomastix_caulleri/5513~~gnl/Chilomastix_caulleri/5513.p1  ORF type:complete len:81 (+),score=16.22 gnl/Chilomastix_caulleri/5513:16-258(+)
MPPTVPIDRGIVILFKEGLEPCDIGKDIVDECVKGGCSTLLVGEGNWKQLSEELLEIETFESKAGKIGAYYGDFVPKTVK